jgi:hypothetical protein
MENKPDRIDYNGIAKAWAKKVSKELGIQGKASEHKDLWEKVKESLELDASESKRMILRVESLFRHKFR